ncbi:MAG: pilus assembly protein PilM, partial [Phycisphaerae bacterium]
MSGRARPNKIVAIDWDASTLRVVHALMGKRGVKIDRLLSVEIPSDLDPANPEQMGLYIRRTLDQEGIGTKHAIVDIPRDQTILKILKLPAAQPDELPGMVEIQIAKELPFPVREAVIDFVVGPHTDDAATADVLVAAVRREQSEQYQAIFAAAGLRLDRIGLRPYANKVAACELLKHGLPERVLFIDVRPTFMEIDVLRNSAL